MVKKHDKLGGLQYISLISTTILGVIVISLPKIAAESAQEGALLSTFLAGVLVAIFAVSMNILGRRFQKKTVIEYLVSLLGKPLGKFLGVILIIYFMFSTSLVLRGFSDALKGLLLHSTPLEVIMVSMLFTAVYLSLNGINAIAKISELFLPIIILSLILVIGLSINSFSYVRLRPVLFPPLWRTVKGMPNVITAFLGYEIILLIIPFVERKKADIPRTLIGIAIPTVLYILLVIMAVGAFGLRPSQQINYPTIALARIINFPGAFADRFDIFFVILWILAAFTSVANLLYISSLSTVRLFGLRNYQTFIYILTPIVYMLAILPQDLPEIRKVNTYVGYLGAGISMLVVGLLIFALVFGKKEHENG
ncbi:MAG TPA: endospore germination permease [Clostridia bacterium]|nr:endospore germination permease [Clostridia bacterium]